jgi:hypothetical protein
MISSVNRALNDLGNLNLNLIIAPEIDAFIIGKKTV